MLRINSKMHAQRVEPALYGFCAHVVGLSLLYLHHNYVIKSPQLQLNGVCAIAGGGGVTRGAGAKRV